MGGALRAAEAAALARRKRRVTESMAHGGSLARPGGGSLRRRDGTEDAGGLEGEVARATAPRWSAGGRAVRARGDSVASRKTPVEPCDAVESLQEYAAGCRLCRRRRLYALPCGDCQVVSSAFDGPSMAFANETVTPG